jgi:hypothetical protein
MKGPTLGHVLVSKLNLTVPSEPQLQLVPLSQSGQAMWASFVCKAPVLSQGRCCVRGS